MDPLVEKALRRPHNLSHGELVALLSRKDATELFAATTALQALDGRGRERGVLAGANVMMPNVTDTAYRKNYRLYDRKPCLGENAAQCRSCLERRVLAIGEKIGWGCRGDSPHCRGKSEE